MRCSYICVFVASFLLVSCINDGHIVSLTINDQPGEILKLYTLTQQGVLFEEETDPPNYISLSKLDKEILYLSKQYNFTPGGWGPVELFIKIDHVPQNIKCVLNEWDKLCLRYSVPYILTLLK